MLQDSGTPDLLRDTPEVGSFGGGERPAHQALYSYHAAMSCGTRTADLHLPSWLAVQTAVSSVISTDVIVFDVRYTVHWLIHNCGLYQSNYKYHHQLLLRTVTVGGHL